MEQKEFKAKSVTSKWMKPFIINIALLVFGIMMSVSGLIIQIYYHVLKNDRESFIFTLNQFGWNAIHKWTAIIFVLLVAYHIFAHLKYYKSVFKKKLFSQHRPNVILTILMLIVTITGLVPLLISNASLRHLIVEIHDKIGVILFIVALGHVAKRLNWYVGFIRTKF